MSASGEGFRRENRTIDPMDFHTPGPGKDASPMSTRLPHEAKHLINILISSKETPFQTPGEVLRCATVWFLSTIVPRFNDRRLEEGLRHLNNYIDGAEHDALIIDAKRMQKVMEAKIGNLIAIGATLEAGEEYRKALRVAAETSPRFGQVMKAWASNAGSLAAARMAAEAIEAEEKVTDASVCACGHRYDVHRIVVNEDTGEVHTDCRPKKGGKVVACPCEEWVHERREVER